MHEVENMFFVGETPWHGLGTKIEGSPTSREAICAAGLDWEVGLHNLCTVPRFGLDNETVEYGGGEVVTHRASYRMTDGAILGVVGPGWAPLQNKEAFQFFDPFVVAGQAAYETAGSLRGGQRVWVLARLVSEPIVILPGQTDDTVRPYILLSNGHDGVLGLRCGFTPVRVVCANTLAMAHDDGASKLIRIAHHKNVAKTLEKVRDAMDVVRGSFEATAEQYRALARAKCSEADLKRYVKLVFEPKKTAVEKMIAESSPEMGASLDLMKSAVDEITGENATSRLFKRIAELAETGRGASIPGVKGTYWGAYNALNEYINHERGRDAAIRLESAWFGQGASQNARALKVATEMAAGAV